MARLPKPGGDKGKWGSILNEYLSQVHAPDGALKTNSVTSDAIAPNAVTAEAVAPNSITNSALASNSVNATIIADGSITEKLLDTEVRTKLNTVSWDSITNKPAVIAAGTNATAAKATLALTKSDVGLANVDNTSDATKNSTAATLTNKTISGLNNTITNLGVNLKGTFAALPSAGTVGRFYVCTDVDLILYDNGTSWDRIQGGMGGGMFTAPPASGWSTNTMGTDTVGPDKDGRLMTIAPTAGAPLRVEYRPLSSTSNYTFTVHIEAISSSYSMMNQITSGIFLSDGTKFIHFGPLFGAYNFPDFGIYRYESAGTGISESYSYVNAQQLPLGIPKWLRIRDDSVNHYYEYSYNNIDWVSIPGSDEPRDEFLTATQIGWGGSNSSISNEYVRLRSWSIT